MRYSENCHICNQQIFRSDRQSSFACMKCCLFYYPESSIIVYDSLQEPMDKKYRYYYDLLIQTACFEQYINFYWSKVFEIKPFDLSLGKEALFNKLKKLQKFI